METNLKTKDVGPALESIWRAGLKLRTVTHETPKALRLTSPGFQLRRSKPEQEGKEQKRALHCFFICCFIYLFFHTCLTGSSVRKKKSASARQRKKPAGQRGNKSPRQNESNICLWRPLMTAEWTRDKTGGNNSHLLIKSSLEDENCHQTVLQMSTGQLVFLGKCLNIFIQITFSFYNLNMKK